MKVLSMGTALPQAGDRGLRLAATSDGAGTGDTLLRRIRGVVEGLWPALKMQPRAPRAMRVVETLHLGPKKQLVLISCKGERFLVGTGTESVDTIIRLCGAADEL